MFYRVATADDARPDFVRRFLDEYLGGYTQEKNLAPFWLRQLPPFLRFRQIILYAVILHARDGEGRSLHPWEADVLARARHTLEHDLPVVDFGLA